MKHRMSIAGLAFSSVAFLLGAAAQAQVDCSVADNLCTGNPCTIGEVEVLSPCVVDFGARTLILSRTLKVPDDGVLSFTAEDIEVRGKVLGRHTAAGGDGADVSLIATDSIGLFKRIDVSGRASAGAILLDAGGIVDLRASLTSSAKGTSPSASGGQVTVNALLLTGTRRGRIKAKGKNTPGGAVSLNANAVAINGQIDARGSIGGMALIAGSAGAVIIGDKIEVDGTETVGGTINVSTTGNLELTTQRKLDADGRTVGGTITLNGGATVTTKGNLFARGNGGTGIGGAITLTGQSVSTRGLRVRGRADAGTLGVTATGGTILLDSQVDIRSVGGAGGNMVLQATGDISLPRTIHADGETAGGTIDIESTGGSVVVEDRIDIDADPGAGGSVAIAAAVDISIEDGTDADGTPGGTIVAAAGNDLTADGIFHARTGGCIALTAGGTLNVAAATFDPPLSLSCP